MTKKNRKTVGSIARELQLQTPQSRDPIEIQREAQKDYIDNLEWAVRHMQKKVECNHLTGEGRGHENCANREAWLGDCYVVVITKKEKLLENVLRNYFFGTMSCPTPDYNQSVYKYNSKSEQLEYLWTVPDEDTCAHLAAHAFEVAPEERQLLQMVLDFRDGTLLRKARALNGESISEGIILDNTRVES